MGLVTIEGKVLLPNGSPALGGTMTVTLSDNGKWTDGGTDHVIAGGRVVYTIPSNGDLADADPPVTIVPLAELTPSGLHYTAEYRLLDRNGTIHGRTEIWDTLTAATPQDIGAISEP